MFFPGCTLYRLQNLMSGWYDMPLAKIDQFISDEAFLFLFPRSVLKGWCSVSVFLTLSEEIWLCNVYLSLKVFDVRGTLF